ncbi:hypothetical protein FIBSPDRAFT_887634 [Athelia psychrophila]|uniref:Uncharacterized protein n=1 Tax=Athelia psychrophila TaxID=1759441 RepID=A0A166PCK3_9AGAM|nr:hypothetical protein FIBSPDRAFT_887634 [Fibularhizoctonia sp. CBS 109695]
MVYKTYTEEEAEELEPQVPGEADELETQLGEEAERPEPKLAHLSERLEEEAEEVAGQRGGVAEGVEVGAREDARRGVDEGGEEAAVAVVTGAVASHAVRAQDLGEVGATHGEEVERAHAALQHAAEAILHTPPPRLLLPALTLRLSLAHARPLLPRPVPPLPLYLLRTPLAEESLVLPKVTRDLHPYRAALARVADGRAEPLHRELPPHAENVLLDPKASAHLPPDGPSPSSMCGTSAPYGVTDDATGRFGKPRYPYNHGRWFLVASADCPQSLGKSASYLTPSRPTGTLIKAGTVDGNLNLAPNLE